MSQIVTPIYRTEAGVHNNPAIDDLYNTHCQEGEKLVPKTFKEVFIHWDETDPENPVWVEDPVFIPGQSIVALKVTNPCDDNFSYINYGFNNFRLDQLCCKPPVCPNSSFTLNAPFGAMPNGQVGVPYEVTGQIADYPQFTISETATWPDWMTVVVDEDTGVVTFSGTPTEESEGQNNIDIYFNSCGRLAAADSPGSIGINAEFTINP